MAEQKRKIDPEYIDMLRAMIQTINYKLKKIHPRLVDNFRFDDCFIYDKEKQLVVPLYELSAGCKVVSEPDRLYDMERADECERNIVTLAGSSKWECCMKYIDSLQEITRKYNELKIKFINQNKFKHYEQD